MQLKPSVAHQAQQKTAQIPNDIIQVNDITRELPLGNEQIPILRGISFAIPRYTWTAIMGPSGSGKSTLLSILAGLDTPSSGQISVDGVDITHMDETKLARFRN